MKKIIFLMLLLPTVSFANNNDIGVHYTSWDLDGCCTVDGFGIDYSGLAGDNSLLVDLTYERVSEGGVDFNFNILSLAYAFGNANEGAFNLGMTRFDGEGESESDVMVGYGRRGGEGVDYQVGLINTEDDATFMLSLRGESGIKFTLFSSDGDNLMTLGYSWRLNQ